MKTALILILTFGAVVTGIALMELQGAAGSVEGKTMAEFDLAALSSFARASIYNGACSIECSDGRFTTIYSSGLGISECCRECASFCGSACGTSGFGLSEFCLNE